MVGGHFLRFIVFSVMMKMFSVKIHSHSVETELQCIVVSKKERHLRDAALWLKRNLLG